MEAIILFLSEEMGGRRTPYEGSFINISFYNMNEQSSFLIKDKQKFEANNYYLINIEPITNQPVLNSSKEFKIMEGRRIVGIGKMI